ncbi:hypothetical protein RHGRI_037020 [Rhododendron griersonianum]|uniref:DNA replication licensing factor MCM6 n=1 Tax=Rhododendron griersonianum TaxID=479676 RepID=A0AAV6HTY0_9ERIC|nr:hypothetical protein RHGRI_037020 [Rhododendron griersonianum]
MCIRWLTYVGMGVLAYVGMGGLPELLNSPIGIRRRLRKGSLCLSALILSQIKAFDKAVRGVDEEPGKMMYGYARCLGDVTKQEMPTLSGEAVRFLHLGLRKLRDRLRNFMVIFTGTVVVITYIMAPGERAECRREASQRKDTASSNKGVRGLQALGVRDLSYHLAFIANSVQVSDGRRDTDMRNRKKDAEDEDNQQFTEPFEIKMDIFGCGYFVDEKAVRVENIFLEFLKSFRLDQTSREPFYESEIEAMRPSESNTMFIDFSHVMRFNDLLQKAISDEYLRLESYLKNACKRFVMEQKPTFITDDNPNKDVNVAFFNLPLLTRLRDWATADIGKLVSVSGVVTRTSEVRPELLKGTFKCLVCGNVIKNVEQQFKYTEPIICMNATCNKKAKWALLRQESKFADWQRVRMQLTSKEIPAGSLPRSLDIILRHDIVEQARAGDTVLFTGTVVVIPDIMALASPGDRAECRREASQRKDTASGNEGVRGLRALGVRDLSYRLAFIANSVQVSDGRRDTDIRNRKKDADDEGNQQFTPEELDEVQ